MSDPALTLIPVLTDLGTGPGPAPGRSTMSCSSVPRTMTTSNG